MSEQCIDREKDNFAFRGFEPNRFFKAYCKQIYCLMEERSPCDATKNALISRTKNGFEGSVRIISGSCTFLITADGSQPRLVIEELYSQFTQQIHKWIQNREFTPTKDHSATL